MSDLFNGEIEFGGLKNEKYLVKICPQEFKRNNKWSELASNIFFKGADIRSWKWKNLEEKQNQLNHFKALISGFGLKHEDKIAVAGWMLSEMLVEVPKN